MDTVVFKIYENECKLRMIFHRGEDVGYEVFRFGRELLKGNFPDYGKIVSLTMADYLGQEKIQKMIYVLPDRYVFYDYIETPTIFGKRRQDTLALELAARFPMHGAFRTVSVPIEKSKGKVASVAYMVRENHLASIRNAMKMFKVKSCGITFEAAMYTNAFLACDPPQKHANVMFAAVRNHLTKVVVVREGRLLFFTDIPYGKNVCAVKRPFASAPSVLSYGLPPFGQGEVFSADHGKEDNNRYLIRTLTEMRDTVSEKYHLKDLALKYSIYDDCADDFARCAAAADVQMQRVKSDTLVMSGKPELYGAFSAKNYNKGLLLR